MTHSGVFAAVLLASVVLGGHPPMDAAACPDGVCQSGDGETIQNCPQDCYCGDGECQFTEGETDETCPQDCNAPPPAFVWAYGSVLYPNDGHDWTANIPCAYCVGDCFGNCGKGCSDSVNPCGGPWQHWKLTLATPAEYGIESYVCEGEDRHRIRWDGYRANGIWTYHGYRAVGCVLHDAYCREGWLGCLVYAGCGSGSPWQWSWNTQVFSSNWSNYSVVGVESNHPDCQ